MNDLWSMFPLIFQSVCAHKISVVQHFTITQLCLERHERNMCKSIFERNIYVHSKFACVRSSHDLCAHAQLRGNIASGL